MGAVPLVGDAMRVDVADVGSIEFREESYSHETFIEYCDNPLPTP